MPEHECRNCELGLRFSTLDELRNHQAKFCAGSNYNDQAHLDAKMASLKRPVPGHAKGSIGDITDYLNGKQDMSQALPLSNPDLNYYSAISPGRKKNDGIISGEYDSVARTEGDLLDMLGDMQRKKEDELRAQIEKEEVSRLFQNVERRQLGTLGKNKQAELDDIMKQGQDVLDRENALANQVKSMQANLVSKESAFAGVNDTSTAAYDDQLRSIQQRENQRRTEDMANVRANQVAQVKAERERLEQERQRIMQQLGESPARGGSGAGPRDGSRGGFRKNASAQRLGVALSSNGFNRQQSPALGGDIKSRLVADQSRLNALRQDHQDFARNNPANDFNDVDVLQRELSRHPNYYNEVQKLTDEYSEKNVPQKDEMLGDIRRALEHESAAPRSVPQKRHTDKLSGINSPQNIMTQHGPANDNNLLGKLDELESLLVQSGANSQSATVPRRPPRPPTLPPQVPVAVPQPSYYQQPMYPQNLSVGYAGVPQQQPMMYQDPAMSQFAQLLNNQATENKQLKEVLEKFGKETASVEQLDGTIDGATRQLLSLKNDPMSAVSAAAGLSNQTVETAVGYVQGGGLPFPDEFQFKQNETRVADLEREERALMNLQAQEFDQLRMLQRLDKNSDLYEYKLKQFKELSAMRAEAEKVLQEQRIEKLKRDFDREKADDDREAHHQLWLENQKRLVLEARVSGAPQQQQQQQFQQPVYQPPVPQAQAQAPPPIQRQPTLVKPKPFVGQQQVSEAPDQIFDEPKQFSQPQRPPTPVQLQFDSVFNLPRTVGSLKLVAAIHDPPTQPNNALSVGPVNTVVDPNSRGVMKAQVVQRSIFPEAPESEDAKILIELQAVDPSLPAEFLGVGWTWINLRDRGQRKVRSSVYTLPIYKGSIDLSGRKPTAAPGLAMTVIIGKPNDSVFTTPPIQVIDLNAAPVPREHASNAAQLATKRPSVDQESRTEPPSLAKQNTEASKARRGFDPSYKLRGLTIVLHYVQNLAHFYKLTVRCSLHHGGNGTNVVTQDNGQQCELQAPSVPDDSLLRLQSGKAVMVNPRNNKLEAVEEFEIGEVQNNEYGTVVPTDAFARPLEGFSFTWLRDLHQLYWQTDGDEPIVLLLELFGKTGPDAKRTLLAYAVSDIVDRQFGKLITGFYESQIYAPPVTLQPIAQKAAVGQSVAFTVHDPDDQPIVETQPRARSTRSSQRPDTGAQSTQFIANFDKQLTLADGWLESDALDIYIDGARHLPDNATVVKCTARVVDSDINELGPAQVIIAKIEESTLRNQVFRFKYELRFTGTTRATALLYLKFETVDKSKGASRSLGSSYFPLFLRAEDGMPAATNDNQGIVAHVGSYQMPIYAGLPNIQKPFTYEKFVYMERVPTASVLLRVMKAPKDQFAKPINSSKLAPDEVDRYHIPAPAYKDGVYSTQYFPLTDDERAIMTLRRRRKNPPLGAVYEQMMALLGRNSNDIFGEERIKYLTEALTPKVGTPMLDLDFFSQYEPGLGFRVNVEAVHDNKIKGFLGVLASVIPPGSYYEQVRDDAPLTDGFMFTELDYSSKYHTQKYNEGDAVVIGFAPKKPGLSILFDIKVLMPQAKKYVSYGFAVLPLLDILETDTDVNTLEYYVASGVFSLPVYDGSPSPALVAELRASTDPAQLLASKLKEKSLRLLTGERNETSLIVRCIDQQRKNNFLQSFEKKAPSTKYLQPNQKQTHTYRVIEDGFFSSYEPLTDFLPNEYVGKKGEFTKFLAQSFADSLGIPQ